MSIEAGQHLFATANQTPNRVKAGLLAWWRTGSKVQNAAALRVTKVR